MATSPNRKKAEEMIGEHCRSLYPSNKQIAQLDIYKLTLLENIVPIIASALDEKDAVIRQLAEGVAKAYRLSLDYGCGKHSHLLKTLEGIIFLPAVREVMEKDAKEK